MIDAFLGDDRTQAPADPGRDPAAWVSSLVPEVPVPSGPGASSGAVAGVCLVSPHPTRRAIRLVALILALILGQVSTVGNVAAREEVPLPGDILRAASTIRVVSDSRVCVDRVLNGSIQLSDGRPFVSFDDVAWDDPDDDDDETDEPITWLEEMDRYLCLTASEISFAPAWTETPSSPFFASQRLRC
jgi:hypothetical protein